MGLVVAPLKASGIPEKMVGNDTPITTADIATAVKDTFVNRTAIAPETYPEIFGALLQYTTGVPIVVEYFKKRASYINSQTIDVSFSLERAAVQSSYDLVHNLEIRISEQLSVEINQETTETSVNGTGTIYPGFVPNVGDIFYLKLPDNNVGVFIINSTQPLSIYRGTHYQVGFHLLSNLTSTIDAKLRESVSDELWYDKQVYFNEEATLLSDVSYHQLKSLLRYRAAMISRLLSQFYNVVEKTIIAPNNIFDTYLIEYLLNKISVNDSRKDLCQMGNPYIQYFENCIWKTFLTQDISVLSSMGYTLGRYQQYLFDANMSDIDRHDIVVLMSPTSGFDEGRLTQIGFNESGATYESEISVNQELNIERMQDPDVTFIDIIKQRRALMDANRVKATVSYYFSDRFYYALIHSYESGVEITDMTPLLPSIANDDRIYKNLNSTFYSVSDNAYHDITFFDTLSKTTGSNNDMHIPEIEYMIFDFILNDNVDIKYLVENVLAKFPFAAMTGTDQLYTTALLLHLVDVSLNRIR